MVGLNSYWQHRYAVMYTVQVTSINGLNREPTSNDCIVVPYIMREEMIEWRESDWPSGDFKSTQIDRRSKETNEDTRPFR